MFLPNYKHFLNFEGLKKDWIVSIESPQLFKESSWKLFAVSPTFILQNISISQQYYKLFIFRRIQKNDVCVYTSLVYLQ